LQVDDVPFSTFGLDRPGSGARRVMMALWGGLISQQLRLDVVDLLEWLMGRWDTASDAVETDLLCRMLV